MTRAELGVDAKKFGVTLLQTNDVGAARAELFQHFELGLPQESGWTKEGAKYMLTTVLGENVLPSDVRDKRAAKAALSRILLEMTEDASEDEDGMSETSSTVDYGLSTRTTDQDLQTQSGSLGKV